MTVTRTAVQLQNGHQVWLTGASLALQDSRQPCHFSHHHKWVSSPCVHCGKYLTHRGTYGNSCRYGFLEVSNINIRSVHHSEPGKASTPSTAQYDLCIPQHGWVSYLSHLICPNLHQEIRPALRDTTQRSTWVWLLTHH